MSPFKSFLVPIAMQYKRPVMKSSVAITFGWNLKTFLLSLYHESSTVVRPNSYTYYMTYQIRNATVNLSLQDVELTCRKL